MATLTDSKYSYEKLNQTKKEQVFEKTRDINEKGWKFEKLSKRDGNYRDKT